MDDELGAVSLTQDNLIDERTRDKEKQGGGAWCPLDDQFNLMYVFDILAYNKGRTLEEVRYNPNEWKLVLTGNRNLFASKSSKPRYLRNAPVHLSANFISRLKLLDDEQLDDKLGDVLDRKRVRAILARRDLLLQSAGAEH